MMKTLSFVLVAGLYISAPALTAMPETSIRFSANGIHKDAGSLMLIGTGRIRSKNGNNYTIQSNDGNTYSAECTESYVIGSEVYHSDPVNGWVEILGLVE
jgi:hypothetical protein